MRKDFAIGPTWVSALPAKITFRKRGEQRMKNCTCRFQFSPDGVFRLSMVIDPRFVLIRIYYLLALRCMIVRALDFAVGCPYINFSSGYFFIYYDELAHHAHVFMFKNVAMIHIGCVGI